MRKKSSAKHCWEENFYLSKVIFLATKGPVDIFKWKINNKENMLVFMKQAPAPGCAAGKQSVLLFFLLLSTVTSHIKTLNMQLN